MPQNRKFLPEGQNWIIDRMQACGYLADPGGVCFGIGHASMQAFLSNDLSSFINRLYLTYDLPRYRIKNDIEDARSAKVRIFSEVKRALKQKTNYGNFFSDPTEEQKFKDAFRREFEEELAKPENMINGHLINSLLEIPAFFDEVEILHQPDYHEELFEKEKIPRAQDAKASFEILQPEGLVKRGNAVRINSFIGGYDRSELITYFQSFIEASKEADFRISLMLHSGDHTIHVGYSKNKITGEMEFIFVNPTKLPVRFPKTIAKLSDAVMRAFTENGMAVFESEIYVTGLNQTEAKFLVERWRATSEWQKMHDNQFKSLVSDSHGFTLLHLETGNRNASAVSELLGYGAEPNACDIRGITPLHIACDQGDLKIAQELIDFGADVNCKDTDGAIDPEATDGIFPLFIAAKKEDIALTKLLLKSGADVNQLTRNGTSSLFIPVQEGYVDIVKELISHKAKLDIKISGNGGVLLGKAETKGRLSEVEALLKDKSTDNSLPEALDDFSLLHAAAFFGHKEIVKLLLEKGLDVEQTTNGITPLEFAKAMNHEDIVKLIESHQQLTDAAQSSIRIK